VLNNLTGENLFLEELTFKGWRLPDDEILY